MQTSTKPISNIRLIINLHKMLMRLKNVNTSCYYATTVDMNDLRPNEYLPNKRCLQNVCIGLNDFDVRFYKDQELRVKEVSDMSKEELDTFLLQLMSKNKEKKIEQIINDCSNWSKPISENVIKDLLNNYSNLGKPEFILNMQKYSEKVFPYFYYRNGAFMHYLAKAHCLRGNSEKGLSILQDAYKKYESFRSYYRIIFRDLIHDSVANRSEASLVIFKKYVLRFSNDMGDHYPLVCLWHICWSSNWFSDQLLSNELLESSVTLQNIVKDKATAFAIIILRGENNEDACLRLLQQLLKYNQMSEYTKVLQVLFDYKSKNGDVRGCTEILRNCEVLGISLTKDQQNRFIKMVIKSNDVKIPQTKNFKLKF